MKTGRGESWVRRTLRGMIEEACPGELEVARIETGSKHFKAWVRNRFGIETGFVFSFGKDARQKAEAPIRARRLKDLRAAAGAKTPPERAWGRAGPPSREGSRAAS